MFLELDFFLPSKWNVHVIVSWLVKVFMCYVFEENVQNKMKDENPIEDLFKPLPAND